MLNPLFEQSIIKKLGAKNHSKKNDARNNKKNVKVVKMNISSFILNSCPESNYCMYYLCYCDEKNHIRHVFFIFSAMRVFVLLEYTAVVC